MTSATKKYKKEYHTWYHMDSFFIRLTTKKQLTHDVYELIYACDEEKIIIPGHFLLCDTDATNTRLRRSYSVQDYT